MKIRGRKLVHNPFANDAQRRACYAKDDPGWDCREWDRATHNRLLRLDPTRTATLRRWMAGELKRRFAAIREELRARFAPTANAKQAILDVPDVRQRDHYSCGAACAMSVGKYFGVGPSTLEAWKRLLGTDVEESTRPAAIVDAFEELGLEVTARGGMGLGDLGAVPTIVCVQDYGPRVPAGARFEYGHYLVVIGVLPGYVVCQDPSADNVVAGGDAEGLSKTGSIQAPGRILIDSSTFLRMWHDEDADGEKYIRFGISVGALPRADRLDELGGVIPADLSRAEAVDFVTLAPKVEGTNCGNCKFVSDWFCTHPRVRFAVNDRNCCALWDSAGTLRAWEGTDNSFLDGIHEDFAGSGSDDPRGRTPILNDSTSDFLSWLRKKYGALSDDALWRKYIQDGYRKGASRAYKDARKLEATEGGEAEHIRTALGGPVGRERVERLVSGATDAVGGMSDDAAERMTRALADGLTRGAAAGEIADSLVDELDISERRALSIARTEVIRAHSEGQLDSLESMGVERVGVEVEFASTDDSAVCQECQELEGTVLSIDEARGVIPVHPNCRCAWIPSVPTANQQFQLGTAYGVTPPPNREQPIVQDEPGQQDEAEDDADAEARNSFCPTGKGGGVDPTCSPKRSFSEATRTALSHLPAEQAKLFQDSSNYVLKRMTERAAARLRANVSRVSFHGTVDQLTQHLVDRGLRVPPGAKANGAYSAKSGELHLDGGGTQVGENLHAAEVYAHEYGHAIDGRIGSKISEGSAWRAAWSEEAGSLSRYASTTPAEGFAEFSRAVHTGKDVSSCPRMSAVWRQEGLL